MPSSLYFEQKVLLFENFSLSLQTVRQHSMKLLKYKLLKDFYKKHPDAESPLNRWAEYVESCDWKTHADLKDAFPSADYVGNDRYVFNISGNKYRL